jgi:predicted ATPase/DNA-binding XRE family transcriptional regulator
MDENVKGEISFGRWVRQRRKALDLTQVVLANQVGCAVVTIKKIEQDERRPSRQMAERLAGIMLFTKSERDDFIQVAMEEKSPIRLAPPSQYSITGKINKPVFYLPAYASPIIGRKKEINRTVHQLSHDYRLVTLTGLGGVGKTRLAVAAGWAAIPFFKDGVVFVSLAEVAEPKLVEEHVARELGIKQRSGYSLGEELIEFVAQRRMLIILDNFEHLLPVANWIAKLLTHAPDLRILVTSRIGLNLSMERLLPVNPLSLPKLQSGEISRNELSRVTSSEAVRLFLERAQAHLPDFIVSRQNAVTVAEICHQLDGLPLAIELVAARVYQLPLSNILQRLSQRLDLASHGYFDLPLRQRTLRATFKWSYDLLTPIEKALFPRLGIFSGGFTFEMAEATYELALPDDFSVALSGLVEHNLVVCQPDGRYNMLETIREYALEQLTESGLLDRIHSAHLDYFVQFVEQAAPQLWVHEDEWLSRLKVEVSNLELALNWSLKRKEARKQDNLKGGQIVGGIWYFWLLSGRMHANLRWLDLALERINTPGSVLARLLVAKGVSFWQQGELSKSEEIMKAAIDMLSMLEDKQDMAEALHLLGHIVFDCQRYSEADKLFRDSINLYESNENHALKAILINDLGLVATHQNDIVAAKKYYQYSLVLFEHLKMHGYIAQSCIRLGDLARLEGDYIQAGDLYKRSLTINQDVQSQMEIASSLQKLSFIALHTGDIKRAMALQQQSLAIQWECGNQQGIAECLAAFASTAIAQGDDLCAARLYGAAKRILETTGLPMAPVDISEWKRDEQIARTRSDPDLFELEWSKGMGSSAEGLVDEILSSKIKYHPLR